MFMTKEFIIAEGRSNIQTLDLKILGIFFIKKMID